MTNDGRPKIARTITLSFFLLTFFFLFTACRATPTLTPRVHLRIGSADSTQYLAREVADAYRRAHPNTTFEFFTSNSTTTLRQLAFARFDFAFVEKNPRADELERANATALELGRDAIFIIVNPANVLQTISRNDLKKVFTGEINQWSQLNATPPGGNDSIQVLAREEGSGMRAAIDADIMQGARLTPTALLLPTNLDMLDYVADHPNAIGYVAANIWDESSRTHPLALDNIPATRASISAGTYPLIQIVFLIVPQPPNSDMTNFLEFLSLSEGRSTLYHRISELTPK